MQERGHASGGMMASVHTSTASMTMCVQGAMATIAERPAETEERQTESVEERTVATTRNEGVAII